MVLNRGMESYGERLEAALVTQLKVELVERSMDQKDLAALAGIDRVTLSRYMTGKRSMPMPTYFKIAEVLGLSAQALMRRVEARLQSGEQTA